uniref:E3 ubiquitin-protein ligase RNF180 isoform X3 n=1 Tax=Solea senegalensis TaxID=28829 RepID=UPI001CD8585B|nr:E3 ubiquitin-protein ligase RNF180 isoform X3 [Solea senegalensis]
MMLRCRKCRKGVIDSTCLTTDTCCVYDTNFLFGDISDEQATDEGSAAVCSIWHVNVDALPQWILTSLHQAQWTAGKLNCLNCGARLGGFNFVNRSKCPCGRDTNVHLSKSRVDSDHKHYTFIVRPRDTRLETSRALPPTVDSENNEDSLSVAGPSDASDGVRERRVVDLTTADRQTDDESTLLPVSRPSTQETDTDDVFAVTSLASGGRQLQTVEAVESSMETTTVHQEDSDSTLFLRGRTAEDEGTELRASSASRSLSRREKNRLKSQRRKQRRRERWLLSQQQADVDNDGEEEEKEEDRENLTCTVCLDVYFRPHSCEPCGHVFCELCLRTLAKNRHTKTTCPLCRTLISHTDLHTELDQAAKTSFPKVYLACQQNFTNTLSAKWPLPSGRKRFWVVRRPAVTQRSHWHLFHGNFRFRFSHFATVCLLYAALVVVYFIFSDWTITLLLVCILMFCVLV